MDKKEITPYDDTKKFKEECLPAIVKIKHFCVARGIPFYMTFATADDGTKTEYLTSKQFPPECELKLSDDKFRKIVLAEHGFDLMINHVDSFDIDDMCDDLIPNASQFSMIPESVTNNSEE